MNLSVKVIGERVKPGTLHYARTETEDYVVADVSLSGSTTLVAASLRALANSIDPIKESA